MQIADKREKEEHENVDVAVHDLRLSELLCVREGLFD